MAGKLNITIQQHGTFRKRLVYKNRVKRPIDLTGYGAHMQIRDAAGTLVADLSTDNGKIVLGAIPGSIDLFLSDFETGLMQPVPMFYDFKFLAPNGDKPRLFEGKVILSPGQTKDD